jgi:hypothetical protein
MIAEKARLILSSVFVDCHVDHSPPLLFAPALLHEQLPVHGQL